MEIKRYNDLSGWLKKRWGEKVFKISLTATTTCPNIDGTLATGGCSFCNDAALTPTVEARRNVPVSLQLYEGMEYVRKRHKISKFIAYFQSFTSTYGHPEILLPKFKESLEPYDVAGMALSTRPDCITKEWAQGLEDLKKVCWIELGLQSSNDRTLSRINRRETRKQFEEALRLIKKYTSIPVCAHTVVGLPGENYPEIMQTIRFLSTQPIWGLKIHNLHVVKGTTLAEDYKAGNYIPLSLEEYVETVVDMIERTPPYVIFHRLNAHAHGHLTLAPDWSVNKLGTLNAVEKELEERNSWQGKTLGFPREGSVEKCHSREACPCM